MNKSDNMIVNNMIVETLDPNNLVSRNIRKNIRKTITKNILQNGTANLLL
jgi:hypothetical protein